MNIYCTEASVKYFFSQLKKSGLSDEDAHKVIGCPLIINDPPLTKRIMTNNLGKILKTLTELKYQENFELLNIEMITERSDTHGALFLNSENCIDLFKNHDRITKLNMGISEIKIQVDTQRTYFHFMKSKADLSFYSKQGYLYLVAQRMKKILGDRYDAQKIQVAFTHANVPDEDRFCKSVTERVVTRQDSDYISIPTEMALATNRYYNPHIQTYIEEQLTKEYAIRSAADPFFESILEKIATTIEHQTDEISIYTIANAMNMSRSTLYRNLSERNLTFSQLLEEQRKSMAMDLLVNTRTSIGEISDRLGYKNLSAFNRAFKRWFNKTPLTIRKYQS